VHNYHQPSAGMISTGRYQPYEVSRARSSEHRNAEAGPSTLRFIPYVVPPTLQPSGRTISETATNAKQTKTTTEEHKVPVSNSYCSHIHHVTERSFGVRRLSRPSDGVAATACRCRRVLPTCATGRGSGWGSGKLRPSIWL